MQRRHSLAAVLAAVLILTAGAVRALEDRPEDEAAALQVEVAPEEPVARVNGEAIAKSQLELELDELEKRMARQGLPARIDVMARMRGPTLERIINEVLLWQESRRRKISVDEQEIQARIEKMGQGKEPAVFDLELAAAGLSRKAFADRLRRQKAIRLFIDEVIAPQVGEVTTARALEFYNANQDIFVRPERIRVRHILIRTGKQADAAAENAARQHIENIRRNLIAGQDFATLARQYSQDPISKASGGDLGFFTRGQMVAAFENAAFALEGDQISQVVETSLGLHLIQVTEREPAVKADYAEVEQRIMARLKEQAKREKIDAYVKLLRQGAHIEKFL